MYFDSIFESGQSGSEQVSSVGGRTHEEGKKGRKKKANLEDEVCVFSTRLRSTYVLSSVEKKKILYGSSFRKINSLFS